jgi:branched-chain amino acid transport system ATP-binding protein
LAALSDVSFEVPPGQVCVLIGPNGAGKTTLVGVLSGRISPSSGSVRFAGQDVTSWPAHKRISEGMGYTFQITSIFADLNVRENVALAARRHQKSAAVVDAMVEEALFRTGLSDRVDDVAGTLSYGHQRLLEIAMGLAQKPKLLILDEPTQGLAEGDVEAFKRLIESLRGEITVLLIEHNMDVVMQLADVITVLEAGRVLFEGNPTDVKANALVRAAYLRGDDA